MTSSTTISSQG